MNALVLKTSMRLNGVSRVRIPPPPLSRLPPISMPPREESVKRVLGVAAFCALLFVAGCGGVAELDPGETETVTLATAAVATAAKDGSLTPGQEKKIEDLMVLCHQKPLAEHEGQSMRELLKELAPQLGGVDPNFSKRVKNVAAHGCD